MRFLHKMMPSGLRVGEHAHAQLNESEGSLQFGLRAVAIRTQQAAPKAGGTAVDYRALCAAQEEAQSATKRGASMSFSHL